MAAQPEVELAVYGKLWEGHIDRSLSPLLGFEHLRSLRLAVEAIEGFDGLERFAELRTLALSARFSRRRWRLDVLATLPHLDDLLLGLPGADVTVLAEIAGLQELSMGAALGSLEPLRGHPTLRRLRLHHGTETDLSALATCVQLRDLSIWSITKLDEQHLAPLSEAADLDALSLGALRNVSSLAPLTGGRADPRYLELEQLPNLDTLSPLAEFSRLRACTIFDSRPADKSLRALVDAPALEDVLVGGDQRFPAAEVDALIAAFADRRAQYRQITVGPIDIPRLSWRGLFAYVDAVRSSPK